VRRAREARSVIALTAIAHGGMLSCDHLPIPPSAYQVRDFAEHYRNLVLSLLMVAVSVHFGTGASRFKRIFCLRMGNCSKNHCIRKFDPGRQTAHDFFSGA
jgi:hypothetical protein